ncbi:hypothetical protein [Bacillus multifaciens]|uniref:hypothetical protein n=1 Tax=Bacillus multifaciens TaxID=3068506 RepID=UPI0027420082|nr:hypothetical protein [Bacillus sp. WLY-B-L8]MDP7978869.1 hypothetical protein [Bacillus sp. WLY-B-L8]
MSQLLDAHTIQNGTRFLIYPQNKKLDGFAQPEIVYLNATPGSIKAGPEDDKMYVIDAKDKREYRFANEGPPYKGPRFPPVKPDAQGHFDYISPNDRAFSSMTMFATVRRVLDIWEDYFGHPIQWFFHRDFPKLELIPRVEWDNAHSGNGFLEFGFGRNPDGSIDHSNPYCENFDVLAHETGHTIKNSVIGWPRTSQETEEYHGHHEAFGDIVAITSSMHFDSVLNHLLKNTKGNLFSVNELSRVGELSKAREIRKAFNNKKMSDVGREAHDLSEPFTGGAFDVLVEIFQNNLIERGLISQDLGKHAYDAHFEEVPDVQREFEHRYQGKETDFKNALLDARDYFGKLMAGAWNKTSPEGLRYWKVVNSMIDADQELSNGKYKQTIRSCFDWREITETAIDRPLLKTHIVDELITLSVANEMGSQDILRS